MGDDLSWLRGRRRAAAVNSFQNLDLEIYGYERDGDTERVKVRVLDSPVGGQPPDAFETVAFPAGLRDTAKRLETRDLDLPGLTGLGEDLAAVLLPPTAREFYSRSLDRLGPTEGLRIRLRLGTWALATLPWEYAYVEPRGTSAGEKVSLGFWALNRRLSLVRYEILAVPQESLEPIGEDHLRLIALSAEPKGSGDLSLEREIEAIGSAVGKIEALRFEPYPHATWATLQAALDRAAHIVHFAGHGSFEIEMGEDYGTLEGRGALLFETEDGEVDSRPAEEVALNLNQTGVRLVVLAACEGGRVDGVRAWSGIAPALVRAGIPAVVAMQFRVRDDKALAFSQRFYEHLATGGSIDSAVTAGRLAMFDSKDSYGRDWGAPVLYLNAGGGEPFPQREPETLDRVPLTGRFAANAALGVGTFALAALYYLLHLEPKLSGIYLLGGASLPVLLSLVFLVIDKLFETSILPSSRRWLQRPAATPWLGTVAGLLLVLGFLTSSLYLIPDEDTATVSQVVVTSDNPALEKIWPIGTQTQGEIFFLKIWRPTQVILSPGHGTGFAEQERTLYPWGSIHQQVPSDFPDKQLALLQLAPIRSIANKLWTGRARLQVTRNDERPIKAHRFPRGSIVIGDRKAEMNSARNRLGEKLAERQRRQLAERFPAMESSHERWVTVWQSLCIDCTEEEIVLEPGDEVLIEVLQRSDADAAANEKLLFEERVTLTADPDGVRIVILQEKDDV